MFNRIKHLFTRISKKFTYFLVDLTISEIMRRSAQKQTEDREMYLVSDKLFSLE